MELEYIKIKVSGGYMYGGDQKLFGAEASKSGCGMIAVCDMLLFLSGRNSAEISFSEYSRFVSEFRDNTAYKKSRNSLGIFPRKLIRMLNGDCGEKYKFKFYGRRRFSAEKLEKFIFTALENGLPVITRIGADKEGMPYRITYPAGGRSRAGKMKWHYITVTGISENGELTFSSWGGKGTASCEELYRHFGITGGLVAPVGMREKFFGSNRV